MSKPRSRCPMNYALEILGDRWTLLVVRDMIFGARTTFSGLSDMPEGIATNILADRLVRLEAAGIVGKARDPSDGRKRRYQLTEHGLRLIPLLLELMVWARGHSSAVSISQETVAEIVANRDAAVRKIEARVREASAEVFSAPNR